LPETIETYEKAAHLYFDLRRKGVTPRSTIDILITLTAIEHNLLLLHNDKDFDIISEKLTDLKICRNLLSLPR
jgi:predicted nucleic acid-binding protein